MNQENALVLVREQDIMKRLDGGQEFLSYLQSPAADLSLWRDIDKVVDALAGFWVNSSNYKVALLGIDILSLLVENLQRGFQAYYNLVENALLNRLGDQKNQVRDASVTLFTNIMDVATSPQYLFERLAHAFSHKAWRVREGMCRLLVATIDRFGARSLYLSKLLPHICKLLEDPNGQVRNIAVSTIVEIYRHVGDKVKQDLAKKGLPASKLNMLYDQFDIFLQSGHKVVASDTGSVASSTGSFDSADSVSSSGLMRPPLSNTVVNNNNSRSGSPRSLTSVDGATRSSSAQHPRKSMPPPRSSVSSSRSTAAGAVDEESFIQDFDHNLPPIRIYGPRDVEEQLSRIQATLSDEKKDWEERTKALKALRAIVVAGGNEYDTFYQHLRMIEPALQLNAKDLRSQVVRETCITIGFLSSYVKNRFEHSACLLLPILFMLIPNAAKVMSTSGILSIKTILTHTHGSRLIPIVTGYCISKTTSIRRNTYAFINVIFQKWVNQHMNKHIALLKESVLKGINDADSEAREEARKAWHGLYQHFPNHADDIFNNLNASQQKLIKGSVTSSSSVDQWSSGDSATFAKPRISLSTTGAGPRRVVSKAPPSSGLRAAGTTNGRFMRSRSDIDPSSARRSKMKAVGSGYGTMGASAVLPTTHKPVSRSHKPSVNPCGYSSDSDFGTRSYYRPKDRGRPSRVNPRLSTSNTAANPLRERGRDAERPAMSQPGSRSNSPGTQRWMQGLSRTPYSRTTKLPSYSTSVDQNYAAHDSAECDSVFRGDCAPTRTPPSSPTAVHRSRIPVSNSRRGSRAGSRVGSRMGSRAGSPSGSRGGSPTRYRVASSRVPCSEPLTRSRRVTSSQGCSRNSSPGRSVSNVSIGNSIPLMKILPKGREGERALHDALSRKFPGSVEECYMLDNEDDISDTSSVYSDRSASYTPRNGLKRPPLIEDVDEIMQLCQSGLWTERKDALTGLHALINKQKEFSDLQLKKMLETFNRLFADPHGKIFSMFLEMLPDFVSVYKDSIHSWLYVLLTQLLKKMGADLLGSVQAKVLKALQVTRQSFPTELQFNILSRYIVDQTQRPNLKVKVALLHYMLELLAVMDASEITNTSDTKLALSRIITWTTEPKSQDVRKIAESLVLSIFELNAPVFTKMVHVLPKTFQDGAMKVLYSYMKSNGECGSPSLSESSTGKATGRKSMSYNTSSRRDVADTADIRSLRGNMVDGNEAMDQDEIAENFRDITSGIHKLRMDTDDLVTSKHLNDYDLSPTHDNDGASPVLTRTRIQPSFQQQQTSSSKNVTGDPIKFTERTSSAHPNYDVTDALFDDNNSFNADTSFENFNGNIGEIAFALTGSKDKKQALEDLCRTLCNSDVAGNSAASQLHVQWDQHFNSVLTSVLNSLSNGNIDVRITALTALKEMLRHLSRRFESVAEMTIIHILESHSDETKEVVRAAEDAGKVMISALTPPLCVHVLGRLTKANNNASVQICLKMLTNAIKRCASGDLTQEAVSELVPGLLQCYDNPESALRRAAVFCLVALHRVIGDAELRQHLTSLPGSKMKLLQVYIERSQEETSDKSSSAT